MDDDQARELEALEGILSDPSAEPTKLSYGLLKFITKKFSNEISRGGFGVVYKGDLQNGLVAVKMPNAYNVTDKQFMDEIKCLKSANHRNIVRYLGYCADTQEEVMLLNGDFVMAGQRNRLFCFEYVPNGNIRQYLEQEKNSRDNWPMRYQMIRGICLGLQYLHDKKINHLDLKPENIMLDAHMEAKITDFGLSRFLDHGQSMMVTRNIYGTLRYIAPEVIDRGELSFKSDIYALGIIIIELLTGASKISLEDWDESLNFLDCPRARMCTKIARNCTDAKRDNRPTISEVVHDLEEMESMITKSTTNQMVVKRYGNCDKEGYDNAFEVDSITKTCEEENIEDDYAKSLSSNCENAKRVAKNESPVNELTDTSSPVSSEAGLDEVQSAACKSGDSSLFGGLRKKCFKDLFLLKQSMDSVNVWVNGHPISERALRKAEKKAGPVNPGSYWYDQRAGFWGIMGHECNGIIPPFIKEFSYSMSKNCASGNTGVFVNGRELHQKDLDILVKRGFQCFSGKSYTVDISGSVIDDTTGQKCYLGKLAPTIEKMKRGFGMHTVADQVGAPSPRWVPWHPPQK